MKTIVISERSQDKKLHIEAPGCVINITTGVVSPDGENVTVIRVTPDGGRGEEWHIADRPGDEDGIGIRVVEGAAPVVLGLVNPAVEYMKKAEKQIKDGTEKKPNHKFLEACRTLELDEHLVSDSNQGKLELYFAKKRALLYSLLGLLGRKWSRGDLSCPEGYWQREIHPGQDARREVNKWVDFAISEQSKATA